ncbi:MAG: hypothetical protein LBH60_08435 [Prevotellaceae bacterium]|nr:hypothetical protein [Prevotellaceae bacterium]
MKKIKLVLLLVLALYVSCGERYKEERGSSIDGTWTLFESYIGDSLKKVPVSNRTLNNFINAKKYKEDHFLQFYSGGQYDSSFFFRIQEDKLFLRKVLDSVEIIEYYMVDSNGDTIKSKPKNPNELKHPVIYRAVKGKNNSHLSGKNIRIIDTIPGIQKPQNPHAGDSPEKYYGTFSFNLGVQWTLTINRYKVDKKGAPTTVLYQRDIYIRPEERE